MPIVETALGLLILFGLIIACFEIGAWIEDWRRR
jgi:Flp pilus assembly protein TadG